MWQFLYLDVPKSVNDEQKSLLTNFKGIKYSQLEVMIADGKANDQFRRAYLLYALSCFLCPTSQMAPRSKCLGAIVDVQNLCNCNWSKFIFSWLVRQIEAYKNKKGKTKHWRLRLLPNGMLIKSFFCRYFVMN